MNIITSLRIVMAPLVLFGYIFYGGLFSCSLFASLALGDILDGYLARRFNQVSQVGAFLDPLADKLLMYFGFFSLFYQDASIFFIMVFALFLLRDVIVTAMRVYFPSTSIQVSALAKWKSFILSFSIAALLLSSDGLFLGYRSLFIALMLISLFMSYVSAFYYTRNVVKVVYEPSSAF